MASPGEGGNRRDSIAPGEVLALALGSDSSVQGRSWQSVELKLNPHGQAVVLADFYAGNELVGSSRVEISNATARSTVVLLNAGGARFDRVELSAEAGRYGLKGFRNAAVFYFPVGRVMGRSLMAGDTGVELYLPVISKP